MDQQTDRLTDSRPDTDIVTNRQKDQPRQTDGPKHRQKNRMMDQQIDNGPTDRQ